MATSDRVSAQDPISAVSTAELEELEREPREAIADTDLLFNRETAWVRLNERVLQPAEEGSVPLLERAKFAPIYSKNLDALFMVPVAGPPGPVRPRTPPPPARGG